MMQVQNHSEIIIDRMVLCIFSVFLPKYYQYHVVDINY